MTTPRRHLLICALVGSLTAAQDAPGHRCWCWRFGQARDSAVPEMSALTPAATILNGGRNVTRVDGRNGGALKFSTDNTAQRDNAACVRLRGLESVDWSKSS